MGTETMELEVAAVKRNEAKDSDDKNAAFGRGWRSGFYRQEEVGVKDLVADDGRWTESNPYSEGSENAWWWIQGARGGYVGRLQMEAEDRAKAEKARAAKAAKLAAKEAAEAQEAVAPQAVATPELAQEAA